MARKTIADLDLGYDEETGELDLEGFDPDEDELDLNLGEEEEGDTEDDDDEVEASKEQDDDDEEDEEIPVSKSSKVVTQLVKRVALLEQSLPNIIAQSVKNALGSSTEEKDELDELEDDVELTPKQQLQFLAKTVEKQIDKKFDVYRPAMDQAELNAQFSSVAQEYGDNFIKAIPKVAQLMLDTGIKNVKQAYKAYRTVSSRTVKTSGKQDNGKQSSKSPVEKLIADNKKKRRDADGKDSVGEMLPPRTKFKKVEGSDNDVFDNAFNVSMLKAAAAKGRRVA